MAREKQEDVKPHLLVLPYSNNVEEYNTLESAMEGAEDEAANDEGHAAFFIIDLTTNRLAMVGKVREQITRINWSNPDADD